MPLDRGGLDEAVEVLKDIMREVGNRPKPPLSDDEDAWLRRVAAVTDDVDGLDVSAWLCTVAALTLWGPRTDADAASLATYVAEAEGGDRGQLTELFAPVVERWHELDVIDDIGRLTKARLVGAPRGVRPGLELTDPALLSRSAEPRVRTPRWPRPVSPGR